MTILNVLKTVASSGASQTLVGDDSTGTDKVYDITLSAACALALSGTNTGRLQTVTVILRQDSIGGRVATLPAGIAWPSVSPPSLYTKTGYVDTIQFLSVDGVNWSGYAALPVTAAALALSAFSGTTYAGQSLAVNGSYIGPVPANLDYSIDGGAWTTLASGALTATNGGFSFSIASEPAAGSHNLQVRVTNNTGEVSPAQTFAIAAVTAPTNASAGVSAGNGQNTLAIGATINGSNVTQFTIYRGTSAGGEGATALAIVTSGITNGSSTASASYVDSGLTNGTAYYYKVTATNGVETSAQSAEASGTPAASALAHYLTLPAAGSLGQSGSAGVPCASTSSSAANDCTSGVIDIQFWAIFPV